MKRSLIFFVLMLFPALASGQTSKIPQQCVGSSSTTAETCTTLLVVAAKDVFVFTPGATNTGAFTLAINGGSAMPVLKWLGTALVAGDLVSGKPLLASTDGTNVYVMTIGNAPSGGGTVNNPNGSFTQGETLASANSATGAYSSPAVIYASTYTGSDKCAILTAAMSAATSLGGTVVVGDFPPNANYTCASGFTVTPGIWLQLGNYTLTLGGTVTVNSQGRLTGTQNGSTSNVGSILAAATNLNSPVVLLQDASGPSGFWQGGEFAWIRINGNGSNQSSPASCVQIVQPADAGSAHNYEVKSCGSYGVEFDGVTSGTTGMYDVSIFSGLAGGAVYFNGAVSSVVLNTFHVGGNVGPAITCKAGAGGFGLVLNGFQIEGLSVASAASPTAILIDETTSICQVAGWGLSASSVISGTDYIERVNGVSTSLPSVNLENVLLSSGNYTNLFHDNVNSYVVPLSSVQSSASSPISVWHNNMEARQLGAIALQPATLTLGSGANANVKLSTSGGGSNGYAESHFIVSGPTAAFSISGFVGGGGFSTGSVDGHFVILENPTAFAMTLTNLDSGSTSGNQILTGTGSSVTLSAGQSAILMYNVATTQWHLISAGTGGGTPSSPTLSFQYNNGGVFGGITPATTNGLYYPVENVTANVATAPQLFQVGMGGRAITLASTSDTIAGTDVGSVVNQDVAASGTVTETLPTATTLLNPAMAFVESNHSAQTLSVQPSTWTIQQGTFAEGATLSLPPGAFARIKVDPNSSTNWLADVTYQLPTSALAVGSNSSAQPIAASLQGTDTKLMTAGTVSGTAASLCTDANGGATTSGCSGGTPAFPITVTGGVSGAVPCFTSTTNEAAGTLLATNALVVGGGSGVCPSTGNGDFTYATHTLAGGASGVLDLHAMGGAGLILPAANCTGNGALSNDQADLDELCYSGGGYTNYMANAGTSGVSHTTCINQVLTAISSVPNTGPTCTSLSAVTTADYTNATSGQTSITGLSFPVAASTNYSISCHLIYQGSVSTAGMILSSTGPASPTKVTADILQNTTSGAGAVFYSNATDGTTFGFTLGTSTIVTTAADMLSDFHLGLRNGTTAGTFQLTAASSGTGTLTIKQGSSCTIQ